MGAVYEAEHQSDGRVVALKLLTVDLDKMDARERFLREGQTAAAINHPNAVYIYGTEEIEGTPAITMELVPGGTLDEKIKAKGALPWAEAVEDILQVIDGLDAAYNAGVLHRDVKPSNCFVGPGGTVKIGDFGLSKPIDGSDQLKLTQTGLFLGTPVFSSPEQLLGETIDVRSDIYAVGVTFYSLLTGALPYQSGSMMQVVASVLNGVPAPMTNYRSDLPEPVRDVVMKAMARKASDRYQTYEEFRTAVAALRVVERAPATLWDRFRASVVDWVVNVLLLALISAMFIPAAIGGGTGSPADWRRLALSFAITVLVVGIPEALRGVSIGKWVIGIRVVGPDGLAPGFPRETGRILILAATDVATLALQMSVVNQNAKAGATFLATIVLRGLLLLTARKHNGWRLVHDFATGTRVVRPVVTTVQRRGETSRVAAPKMSGTERHVGPYTVLGLAIDGSPVLNAWDGAMRRAVFIVPQAEHEPETSTSRRVLSRLTRLRWVGGHRDSANSWDAFEAPVGELLSSRLARPVTWEVQQHWLLDISGELIAAEADGTSLDNLTAASLWVTPTDRLVFLEGMNGDGRVGTAARHSLVAQLCAAIEASRVEREPLPRYATRTIEAVSAAPNPAAVQTLVQQTLGRPLTVTRARRMGMTLATMAPIIAFSFIGWFSMSQSMRLDRAGFLMANLLSFVDDSSGTNADSVKVRVAAAAANPSRDKRLGLALETLGLVPTYHPDTVTPPDTLRRQRRLAEVYLSTVLSARARDSITQSTFGNTRREQVQRKVILARNTNVDSADARAARYLVDSMWKGVVPGVSPGNIPKFIPFVLVGSVLILGAAISFMFGLFVRRGPMLRGFQLDLSTKSGQPAGRGRLLVRNVVVWSVLLAPLPVVFLAPQLSVPTLATAMTGTFALYLLVWTAALWRSYRTPSRGLAERLSGTWLVPE